MDACTQHSLCTWGHPRLTSPLSFCGSHVWFGLSLLWQTPDRPREEGFILAYYVERSQPTVVGGVVGRGPSWQPDERTLCSLTSSSSPFDPTHAGPGLLVCDSHTQGRCIPPYISLPRNNRYSQHHAFLFFRFVDPIRLTFKIQSTILLASMPQTQC